MTSPVGDCSFRTVELSDPAFERDGLRAVTVSSRALRRRSDVTVWVPESSDIGTLLILLHGVYGSHWVWSLKGSAHITAQQLLDAGEINPMVIAMPGDGLIGEGSGYLTHPDGEDVERWIIDEVPAIARLAAPALASNARIAIAGLSMGGYGALRLGAKYADRFSAISAHSAITGIEQMKRFVEDPLEQFTRCAAPDELSPLHWLRLHRDLLPTLRFDCGVDDDLIAGNRALHQALLNESIAHHYEEFPGGHAWSYWQKHLAKTLRFVNSSTASAGRLQRLPEL